MKPANEIKSLTGLRGFAALWVALFHFQFTMFGAVDFYGNVYANRLITKGSIAVDFFFVLSGFVLAYSAQNWRGENPVSYTFSFLRSRLARIYPIHVVTLLMMLFLVDVDLRNNLPGTLNAVLTQLSLTHAWGEFTSPDLNYPSWSLSAEWAAYLAFPFLLFASRFVSRRPLAVVASCLAAALGLAYLGATLGGGKCDFTWNFGWVRCLAEFWIGLCLFQAHRYADGRFSARARTLWTIAAIAAFSIYIRFGDINAWIVPVAALVVFATSLESSLVRRVFANRVSHRIGEISFSMYMLHVPLGMSLMRATMQFPRLYQNTVSSIATVTSVVIILLIASSLTYDYFEMPMKRWLSRKPKTQSLVFDQVQTKLAS